MQAIQKLKTYPLFPLTRRGYTSPFVITSDGQYLAYGAKKTVVIRHMDNLFDVKIFMKHSENITAIGINPFDTEIASVDSNNRLLIWDYNTFEVKKDIPACKVGKVNGIIFTDQENLIVLYGEGKTGTVAKVMDITNPKTEFNPFEGLNKTVLTGLCTRDGSGVLFLGGEDNTINAYKLGANQLLKKNDNLGNRFITGFSISPDGSKIICVSLDKGIYVLDPKTGEIIDTIAKDKSPGNHKMGIMTVQWIDADRFMTGSGDKTVKIWSFSEKKCTLTLNTAEKPGVDQMICGLVTNGAIIVGLTLDGRILQWGLENAPEGKLPDYILQGHKEGISGICYLTETKEIISSDYNGIILKWDEDGNADLIANKEQGVPQIALSHDQQYLFVMTRDRNVSCISLKDNSELWKIESSGIQQIRPSESDNEKCYLLSNDSVFIYKKAELVKKEKIKSMANFTCFDVNEPANEIYVGDEKGKVHIIDLETIKEKQVIEKHVGPISVLSVSPDHQLFSTGDNQRMLNIWKVEDKSCVNNRCGFHNGKITDFFWLNDSNHFMTCGIDSKAILFKNDEQKMVKSFDNLDADSVLKVIVYNEENDFIALGGRGLIFKIKG